MIRACPLHTILPREYTTLRAGWKDFEKNKKTKKTNQTHNDVSSGTSRVESGIGNGVKMSNRLQKLCRFSCKKDGQRRSQEGGAMPGSKGSQEVLRGRVAAEDGIMGDSRGGL